MVGFSLIIEILAWNYFVTAIRNLKGEYTDTHITDKSNLHNPGNILVWFKSYVLWYRDEYNTGKVA